MENFIYEALLVVLTSLSGYIVWLLKEQKKEHDILEAEKQKKEEDRENELALMRSALKVLLRESLEANRDRYVDKGTIPFWAYQHYKEEYDIYRGLKGNGIAPKFMADIDRLPVEGKNYED